MDTKPEPSKLELSAARTIRTVIEALQGGVPFLNVHPDNKPEGLVLCHRKEGEQVGSRATDVAKVRETGVLRRVSIVHGGGGYLCDNRWDWEHVGPLSAHYLLHPVMKAMAGMSPEDWDTVALAVATQHYKHVSDGRKLELERRMDENARRQAQANYEERQANAEHNRRRFAQREDAQGHFTTDKRRNAITVNANRVAVW